MSVWNHRVLAFEQNGESYFQVHEVYYDENDKANRYAKNPISIGSETIEGINWTLNQMLECLGKPILWAGYGFPNEYKITEKIG